MKNNKQLDAIKNTIATINNYSSLLLDTKFVFDKDDKDLLKEFTITTRKDQKITGSRKIVNNGKTNQKIFDFVHILYTAYFDAWLIHF